MKGREEMKGIQTTGFILTVLGGASMDSNIIVACVMAFVGLGMICTTLWLEGGFRGI